MQSSSILHILNSTLKVLLLASSSLLSAPLVARVYFQVSVFTILQILTRKPANSTCLLITSKCVSQPKYHPETCLFNLHNTLIASSNIEMIFSFFLYFHAKHFMQDWLLRIVNFISIEWTGPSNSLLSYFLSSFCLYLGLLFWVKS